jgi:hypothetical protein
VLVRVAFHPVLEGVPITYAVYGLHKDTFVMRNHQTGTIWARPPAFERTLGDAVVELRLEDDRVVDDTGTIWSPEGRGTAGPRAGKALSFLPSRLIDWYAWAAYHPETQISDLRGGD